MELNSGKTNTLKYFNTENISCYIKGTTLCVLFMCIYSFPVFLAFNRWLQWRCFRFSSTQVLCPEMPPQWNLPSMFLPTGFCGRLEEVLFNCLTCQANIWQGRNIVNVESNDFDCNKILLFSYPKETKGLFIIQKSSVPKYHPFKLYGTSKQIQCVLSLILFFFFFWHFVLDFSEFNQVSCQYQQSTCIHLCRYDLDACDIQEKYPDLFQVNLEVEVEPRDRPSCEQPPWDNMNIKGLNPKILFSTREEQQEILSKFGNDSPEKLDNMTKILMYLVLKDFI